MAIQIIVSIAILFVIVRVLQNYLQRRTTITRTIGWLLLWLFAAAIFWSPEIASRLADFFGIGRGADLIVYVAILVIVYMMYRVFVRLEKIDQDITAITRDIALKHASQKEDRSGSHRKL